MYNAIIQISVVTSLFISVNRWNSSMSLVSVSISHLLAPENLLMIRLCWLLFLESITLLHTRTEALCRRCMIGGFTAESLRPLAKDLTALGGLNWPGLMSCRELCWWLWTFVFHNNCTFLNHSCRKPCKKLRHRFVDLYWILRKCQFQLRKGKSSTNL